MSNNDSNGSDWPYYNFNPIHKHLEDEHGNPDIYDDKGELIKFESSIAADDYLQANDIRGTVL